MENATAFSFVLLGLEFAEISGVEVLVLITPSLSNLLYMAQYYETSSKFKSFSVQELLFTHQVFAH